MRSIGGKLSKPPADVLDASRDRLDETWFVSFTSGPYPIGEDRREQYVTAIAAVDQVSGDDVSLLWRDRGSLPTSVPIKLLQAPHVHRFRTSAEGAYRIRVQNEGLRSTGPGGVITGTGWQAHRNSPDRIAFARYRNLSPDDQKSMEADADLDTYDLDAL
jgi:hypothetical protein